MSDHASSTPAPAAGGSKPNPLVILVIVVVFAFMNIIGLIAWQMNSVFQVIKLNLGSILLLAGLYYLFKGTKK